MSRKSKKVIKELEVMVDEILEDKCCPRSVKKCAIHALEMTKAIDEFGMLDDMLKNDDVKETIEGIREMIAEVKAKAKKNEEIPEFVKKNKDDMEKVFDSDEFEDICKKLRLGDEPVLKVCEVVEDKDGELSPMVVGVCIMNSELRNRDEDFVEIATKVMAKFITYEGEDDE